MEDKVEATIETEVLDNNTLNTNEETDKTPEYHVVVKGDNLYNLSKRYNTTVENLSKLNDIQFNNLKIGQRLKLK